MSRSAVIVLGGDPVPVGAKQEIPDDSWVVAADSGLDHALAIGLKVELIVGDLDSASPAALESASTVPRQVFPVDKDATDFELALETVLRDDDVDRIIVVGGHGGRLDHLLGNVGLLTSPRLSSYDLEWVAGHTRVTVIHHSARVHGKAGDVVSLVPLTDRVHDVTTSGLRWALSGAELVRWSTLPLSNELTAPVASIRVGDGVLAAIQPAAWA